LRIAGNAGASSASVPTPARTEVVVVVERVAARVVRLRVDAIEAEQALVAVVGYESGAGAGRGRDWRLTGAADGVDGRLATRRRAGSFTRGAVQPRRALHRLPGEDERRIPRDGLVIVD
jgi:hypothetical protein